MLRFLEGGLARGSRIAMLVVAAAFALGQPTFGAQAAVLKAPSSCPSTSGVKPLIRGLVDRGTAPPPANLDASSINVGWDTLEPNGPTLADDNPIDQAIATAGCTPLRIRVLAGIATPQWVLDQTGFVDVTNPYSNTPGEAGDFWTSKYAKLFDSFESALAADYSSVPNVAEFVVSRCALFYPEPLILGTSIASNDSNLIAAGYTEAADQQCQQEEINTASADWPTQRIGVSFNPYQVLTKVGSSYTTSVDETYTEQMMAYCRYKLGSRCLLENDSIRDPVAGLGPSYPQMYAAMSGFAGPIHLTLNGIDKNVTLGAPIAFQTATAGTTNRIGDFWGTLEWARQMHASSVELPADGTYPTAGGAGAPAWQTLAEVAKWFEDTPTVTAIPLAVEQGQDTTGKAVASVTLDETAAVDTQVRYGDIGSVPFDTVTADIFWPTGVQQTALISINGGPAAVSGTCSAQACDVTIESAGYPFPELKITKPATVMITLANGSIEYVPADGVALTTTVPVTSNPAPLTITKLAVRPAASAPTATLSVTFTDAYPNPVPSTKYTAVIRWGDGKTTTAKVKSFKAAGSHRYAHAGAYTVTITITDSGGATVTGSETITVR
jgi:PKD domain